MTLVSPRRSLFLALALLLIPATALAWSKKGHRIVALAAEEQLSERTKSRVANLLGRDTALVDVAGWADDLIETEPDTEAWHSITIPEGAESVDLRRDCPVGDCITVKIRECVGIVRLAIRPRQEIVESFKMLVGLTADLHQPLLSGYPPEVAHDDAQIVLDGESMSLFEAWDSGLLEALGNEQQVLEKVRQKIESADRDAWLEGSFRQWTWENHKIARDQVYPMVRASDGTALDGSQLAVASEIVVERLAKSAVRLAAVFDEIWY